MASPRLYVRTLGPLLDVMTSLTSEAPAGVFAVNNSGEAARISNSDEIIRQRRPSILGPREQVALRGVIGVLRQQRLYVVVSTTGAHQFHRDEILTEDDLDYLRNNTDIVIVVDSAGQWR